MNLGGGKRKGPKSSSTGKHRNLILRVQSLETSLAYSMGKKSTPQ